MYQYFVKVVPTIYNKLTGQVGLCVGALYISVCVCVRAHVLWYWWLSSMYVCVTLGDLIFIYPGRGSLHNS